MNIYYWQKKMNLTREEREKKETFIIIKAILIGR